MAEIYSYIFYKLVMKYFPYLTQTYIFRRRENFVLFDLWDLKNVVFCQSQFDSNLY